MLKTAGLPGGSGGNLLSLGARSETGRMPKSLKATARFFLRAGRTSNRYHAQHMITAKNATAPKTPKKMGFTWDPGLGGGGCVGSTDAATNVSNTANCVK
mmetsp:Transcript_70939/g.136872  ORF Transcript_70939/g.136872 Transcript_70939/m.136872 type:complete len:100 (+) Transcript_70939:403-702(+)